MWRMDVKGIFQSTHKNLCTQQSIKKHNIKSKRKKQTKVDFFPAAEFKSSKAKKQHRYPKQVFISRMMRQNPSVVLNWVC